MEVVHFLNELVGMIAKIEEFLYFVEVDHKEKTKIAAKQKGMNGNSTKGEKSGFCGGKNRTSDMNRLQRNC